jgi:hypothetical protein
LKKCIHCGAELPDEAKACSNCGWPVGKPDTASGKSPETPPASSEEPSGDHADMPPASPEEPFGDRADMPPASSEEPSGDHADMPPVSPEEPFGDRVNVPQAAGKKSEDAEKSTDTQSISGIQSSADGQGSDGREKPAGPSDTCERNAEGGGQIEPSAPADHGVVWDKDDSEDKIDIPWDPEEADRKKAEARNSGGQESGGSADAGNSGNGGDRTGSGNAENHADQPGGYWFQGKWHPMSDLNADSGGNKRSTDSGSGRYWENGAWHDGPSGGNSDNGWNGSGSNDGNYSSGWNGGGSNGGNSGNGSNGGNYNSGWNGGSSNGGNPNSGWNSGNANGSWNSGQNGGWNGGWNGNQGGSYGPGYPARNNSFAVAAMALAVISIFLNSLYCIPSVLGIFFAIVALNQIRKNPGVYKGKGMAIAALIMCIVLFILYLFAFIEVARLMRDPAFMKQIEEYLQQLQGTSSSSASQAAAVFRL